MASIETILEALDRAEREQQIRDEGLRRAFDLLCSAIERQQSVLDLIHRHTMATHALVKAWPAELQEALQDLVDGD
jgi:hypothetical protein